MKLIGKKVFENNVFVQCDCGQEIIEFCRDSSISNDNAVEYFIQYHGYFSYKVDKCNSFFFLNKSEFSLFFPVLLSMSFPQLLFREVVCIYKYLRSSFFRCLRLMLFPKGVICIGYPEEVLRKIPFRKGGFMPTLCLGSCHGAA